MKVRWPKAKNIPTSLDSYYRYIVWLQYEGKTYMNTTKQPQTSNTYRFESLITGLQFNTHYSVKIEPYRQQNELREAGTSTGITGFKTICIAPYIPTIEKVTMSTQNDSTNVNFNVIWKPASNVFNQKHRIDAQGDIYLPKARTKIFKNSIAITGANIWNNISLALRQMRSNNQKADSEERQTEQPPIEMGAGAIGGVPDYDHLTRVPGEQERPNVYDVIPVYDEIST
ncbi:hypothetical protein LSAT2_000932 [Lamellibrachia satsuma]|nr:hypothetical protein LSAT2_000932 [Lamellibrachia satsuma]